jgi:hypothetical protein
MILKYSIYQISLGVLFGALLMFFVPTCGEEHKEDYSSLISYMDKEREQLISSNNLLAQEVSIVNQNLVSSSNKIKELSNDFDDYKKVQSHVKAEILSKIEGITIPVITVDKPIYLSDTGCTDNKIIKEHFIQIPSKVNFSDTWVSFNGTIGKQFTIDSLSMINKFDVTIGEKKVGKKMLIFNDYEPIVELKSYNPYTTIPYVNNIIVEEKKGKIIKPISLIATGLVAGYLIRR